MATEQGPWLVGTDSLTGVSMLICPAATHATYGLRAAAQAEADRLNARERLADVAGEAVVVVTGVEWGGTRVVDERGIAVEYECCPSCCQTRAEGHRPDCTLAALIAKASNAVPTPEGSQNR